MTDAINPTLYDGPEALDPIRIQVATREHGRVIDTDMLVSLEAECFVGLELVRDDDIPI